MLCGLRQLCENDQREARAEQRLLTSVTDGQKELD